MFGRDNHNDDQQGEAVAVAVIPTNDDTTTAASIPTSEPQDELNLPALASDDTEMGNDTDSQSSFGAPQFVETPDVSEHSTEEASTEGYPAPDEQSEPVAEPLPDAGLAPEPMDNPGEMEPETNLDPTHNNSASTDLSWLKQEALRTLSPLISHLDQSPEEKYATAKMMYDETKDASHLTAVYEAAKNLPEDKAKAEAIYDVIQKIDAANR